MPDWAEWLDKGIIQRQHPLAKYTAARLGGCADYFYFAPPDGDIYEMANIVQAAWRADIPVRVLGGGANVLISDAGVRGLVVINRIAQIEWGDWHGGINLSATSGTGLLKLARACQKAGRAGMAWAIGVPGTVGGAVVNNAGAHGTDTAQYLKSVALVTAERGAQLYTRETMDFDYRHSILKARADKRFLVLMATFGLPSDEPEAIQQRMDDYTTHRKRTQPSGASLGSIFKNPPGDYAGRLIESCGLKGHRVGGAMVSPVHANFMMNTGDATASDYYALIHAVQVAVYERHGILLEMEIETIGDWNEVSS